MKGIIEFDLPMEDEEFHEATRYKDFKFALTDFANYLRSRAKYEELKPEEYQIIDQVRSKLYEIVNERGIEI